MPTTVDLLRHGELVGGLRYRGSIEAELTGAGRAQMDTVWAQIRHEVEHIVSSPLSRCRLAASEWAERDDVGCEIIEDFREMCYGEWEGLSAEEIEHRYPGQLPRWRDNPVGMRIPGAETIEDFAARVTRAWDALLHEQAGRHVLLVAHSGTLRVILAHVLGAPLPATRRFSMPYAAWSRVRHIDGGSFLSHHNRPS